MRRTAISLTGQNNDDVGRFGSVNNENLSGIASEHDEACEQDQYDDPSSSSKSSFHERGAFLSYPNLGICGHCRVFAGGGILVLRAKIALQAVDLALFRRLHDDFLSRRCVG